MFTRFRMSLLSASVVVGLGSPALFAQTAPGQTVYSQNVYGQKGTTVTAGKVTNTPKVYVIRGLSGTFGSPVDDLAKKLGKDGISSESSLAARARSLTNSILEDRQKNTGPLILIAQGSGVEAAISLAQELEKKQVFVDLLLSVDPSGSQTIPGNILTTYNYTQPSTLSRPATLKKAKNNENFLENVNLKDRPDYAKGAKATQENLQEEMLSLVRAFCKPEANPR